MRDNWALKVHTIKDRLDKIIHKVADKENKSKEDEDLEKSLIGNQIIVNDCQSKRNVFFCHRKEELYH